MAYEWHPAELRNCVRAATDFHLVDGREDHDGAERMVGFTSAGVD